MTISTRNENGTNGTKAAYCYSNFGTISIRVSGLASGDTLTYGTTGTSSATITSNGEYSITYSEGYGFTLYGDTSNTDTVTIELINNQYLSSDGLVDVSDNPIIISIHNIVGKNLTNIECWDMYLGEQQVYKRNRTVENCWLKYGFAEKGTGNIYRLTNNCSSHINQPIDGRKYFTPIVSDYKKYFTNKLISYSGDLSDITNPIMGAEYYKLYNTDI